jgi:hypothetical protein
MLINITPPTTTGVFFTGQQLRGDAKLQISGSMPAAFTGASIVVEVSLDGQNYSALSSSGAGFNATSNGPYPLNGSAIGFLSASDSYILNAAGVYPWFRLNCTRLDSGVNVSSVILQG